MLGGVLSSMLEHWTIKNYDFRVHVARKVMQSVYVAYDYEKTCSKAIRSI